MPIQFHDDDSAAAGGDLTPRTATIVLRKVEDYTSKAGRQWIKVSAKTRDTDEWVNCYMPPVRKSIATLCAAVGIEMPEGNEFDEELLRNRECRVKLRVKAASDGYAAEYQVDKWISADAAAAAAAAPPARPASKPINFAPKGPAITTARTPKADPAAVDQLDDGIPF